MKIRKLLRRTVSGMARMSRKAAFLLMLTLLLSVVFWSDRVYVLADGTWSIETVDSAGEVGLFTSLALDSDDNPHISYTDYSNTDLKYATACMHAAINATVDSIPNTLSLRSKRKYITAFIELPEDYNVSDIDVSSISLNGTILVDRDASTAIGDYDNDTIRDLMVKFNGTEVISYFLTTVNMTKFIEERFMTIVLTITGQLNDETPFQGDDTVRIIMPMPRGSY